MPGRDAADFVPPAPTSTGCAAARELPGLRALGARHPDGVLRRPGRTPGSCWSASSPATRRTGRARRSSDRPATCWCKAVDEAGIERSTIYRTNVVKHFRFTQDGPASAGSTRPPRCRTSTPAGRGWSPSCGLLDPEVIVCLGATAAKGLLGASVRVTRGPRRDHRPGHVSLGPRSSSCHDPSVRGPAGRRPRRGLRRPGGRPAVAAGLLADSMPDHPTRSACIAAVDARSPARRARPTVATWPAGWRLLARRPRPWRGDPAPAATARDPTSTSAPTTRAARR